MAEDGIPDIVVIIGPNHRSYSPSVALSDDDAWLTPLGEVPIELDVVAEIAAKYPGASINSAVHQAEHSLEVQLPFLQYIAQLASTRIAIVPILIGAPPSSATLDFVRDLVGGCIGEVLQGKNAVLIAQHGFHSL